MVCHIQRPHRLGPLIIQKEENNFIYRLEQGVSCGSKENTCQVLDDTVALRRSVLAMVLPDDK
jgi:hypothetical protein